MLKEGFLVLVDGADPNKDRISIVKDNYKAIMVLIKDEDQSIDIAKELVDEEGINAFILCAGFSNECIGKLSSELGDNTAVSVTRGDNRSSSIVSKLLNS